MSTWSEAPMRSAVLRGGAATTARAARLDSDLRSTPFASAYGVDARLTDPHLEAVVAEASRAGAAQGHAQGYADGYAEGRAAAQVEAEAVEQLRSAEAAADRRAAQAQLDAALDVLHRAAEALTRREAVAVADVEDVVVALALDVARAVLRRELSQAADPGGDALARALALAPDGTPAVARLHPDDVALLSDVTAVAAGRALQVLADPEVEPGGCVVETAGRRIDAQVGPALDRVAAVLR